MTASGVPPEEVRGPPAKEEAYIAWRATTDLRAPYRVAPEFLRGTKLDAEFDTDEVPLIVFINARSGGRVGPELANVLARALGRSQVFDLSVSDQRPDKVLARMWANFAQQEAAGNKRAALVRSRLRILACGGDGTVAWIMKVIKQLDLHPQPPVAIMPLGTGNDLSRTFSWGAEFVQRWIKGSGSVYSTLKRIADAPVANLDCWRLRLLLPNSSYKPAKTYAMEEVAQPAKAVQQRAEQQLVAPAGGCAGEQGQEVLMEGMFWNYFSVGADAQAAYNFHHLRDAHPGLAGSRLANQFWYSTFSCTSGWFCGTVPPVSSLTDVEVLLPGAADWTPLAVPPTVKALVLVNLQSYGGGRNIWGEQPPKKPGRWRTPSVADGLLEVVGFHSGYHALAVMSSGAKLANGKRMAQVAGIRLSLQDPAPRPDGEPGAAYMQLDGEPWMQQLPPGGGPSGRRVVLEVINWGCSKVLANRSAPDKHPAKKVTKLLTQKQAADYLATDAVADGAAGTTEAGGPYAVSAAPAKGQHHQQQQAAQELRDAHAGDGPAAPRAMLQMQELHAAAGAAPAAAAAAASSKAAPPPLLQHLESPRNERRGAATDGGAPCATTAAQGASAAAVPRRSLDREITATGGAASGRQSPSSSAGSDHMMAPVTPGGVALIEAEPRQQGSKAAAVAVSAASKTGAADGKALAGKGRTGVDVGQGGKAVVQGTQKQQQQQQQQQQQLA